MEKKPASLTQKLVAVQGDMRAIKKTETNPHFKSKFYDINSLIAELKPILIKHGVLVVQPIVSIVTEGRAQNAIQTEVIDTDSDVRFTSTMILPDLADPQKTGGAITYFRRYALTSFFLLEGEEDTDGNTAAPVKEFQLKGDAAPRCATCGGPTAVSSKTGKSYCKNLCWKNPKKEMVIDVDDDMPF